MDCVCCEGEDKDTEEKGNNAQERKGSDLDTASERKREAPDLRIVRGRNETRMNADTERFRSSVVGI